ncbi:MAG: putative bifunctional diguanylate cyclase/phosphodiesterase [Actinomycetota bacterium]
MTARLNQHQASSALWLSLAFGLVGFAVFTTQGGDTNLTRDLVLFNMVHLSAASLCWFTPGKGLLRLGWRLLSIKLLCAVAANAYTAVATTNADAVLVLYHSAGDALWWCYYLLAYLSIGVHLRARVTEFTSTMRLDGLIVGLGTSALIIVGAVKPLLVMTGDSFAAIITNLTYPLLDFLLIVVLLVGTAVMRLRLDRALGALGVAFMFELIADLWLIAPGVINDESSTQGHPANMLWLLHVVAIAFASQLQENGLANKKNSAQKSVHRMGWRSIAIPITFNLMSLCLLAVGWRFDLPLAGMLCAMGCVIVTTIRAGWTFREMRDLPEARRQARTDELTGAANRRELYARCDELFSDPAGAPRCALLLMDLDGFKEVNDALGHHAGDDLLKQVAGRLSQTIQPTDLLARLGGDEFAVILPHATPAEAVGIAWDIQGALAAPFTVDGTTLHIGGSVGVATAPEPAADRGELLRCADIAMYQAKMSKPGGVVRYTPDPNSATGERLRTIEELRGALSEGQGQLLVYLQPQVQLSTGHVIGVEALARWQHPERGLLTPQAFLKYVEQAGLHQPLAEVILDQALHAAHTWWRTGRWIPVSVNLSVANITDIDLPVKVLKALDRHHLPPAALSVELTEDSLMSDPERGRSVLEHLRGNGIDVSIDDYGTGYSSLSYLHDLPADELKLDRSLSINLESDHRARAIVSHTVALAHDLGLRVVAEGIETADGVALLNELGCDIGQGYYLAKPMPVNEFTDWLSTQESLIPRQGVSPTPPTGLAPLT